MSNQSVLTNRLAYAIPKLKLILVREPSVGECCRICSDADVEMFLEPLRHCPEEHFVTLHLNVQHEVIGYHEVSHGTLASSLVHPREVFKAALLNNSHAIILAHNHPSGRTEPSAQDIAVTKQLIKAGKLLNVQILDHIIIGDGTAFSFRRNIPSLFPRRR